MTNEDRVTKRANLGAHLMLVARRGGLTTYKETAPVVGMPPESAAFWGLLGEVSLASWADGVLLSAIVVNKETGYPGNSFFELAEELVGDEIPDRLAFWAKAVRDVHDWYSGKEVPPKKR